MRASVDLYPYATNFCDLPDLATAGDDGSNQKSFFKKLDKLSEIAQNQVYDENLQAQIMLGKNCNPFKEPLSTF